MKKFVCAESANVVPSALGLKVAASMTVGFRTSMLQPVLATAAAHAMLRTPADLDIFIMALLRQNCRLRRTSQRRGCGTVNSSRLMYCCVPVSVVLDWKSGSGPSNDFFFQTCRLRTPNTRDAFEARSRSAY